MLISDIVQTDVLTVAPEALLAQVLHLLTRRGIRHVPVVEDESLVGIISDRDVKSALAFSLGSGEAARYRTAGHVMTRDPITIAPTFPVEEAAARVMVSNGISALPVLDGTRLIGIVTEIDLLRLLSRAMGTMEPSSRLDVTVTGKRPAVDDVVRTIEGTAARISSLMTWCAPAGQHDIVIRLATMDPGPAIRALEAKGYALRDSRRGLKATAGA